ncbi:DUF2690 domain-containing protein, partial [Streptomyces sp. NPDC048629]|uniref:DUF2690 domain-containing protein n=1 Tax=Streptomyces sp. NPDC048629 TaxID=3154824 RepID=UPI003447FF22
ARTRTPWRVHAARAAPPVGAPAGGRGRRRVLTALAAGVGLLLVAVAVVLLVDPGGAGDDGDGRTAPPSSRAPTTAPGTPLPAGEKCAGAGCAGRDPETMGCGGEFATTVSRARVGPARVEVRHSVTCRAAWARLTGAAPGDTVRVTAKGIGGQEALVDADGDAYTPMVAVAAADDARACATLKGGAVGCTGG